MTKPSMETFVSLCKRRGFIFQSNVILSDDHSGKRTHPSPRRNLAARGGDNVGALLCAASKDGCP